ncbi:MAG TPA: tetratricopeptide repeat protein [Chloroflexia bacterium]|nr:tetratricopeptide repeat protein [Chloroflexia bacterium]
MHPVATKNHLQQSQPVYHNLPHQPTPLVGRGREVEAVCAMLRRPEVRLLTLFGPPGIGKTRLAIQAASVLPDDFPDGVCFVPLAVITDPDLVASAVTQALELRGALDESLPERLKGYLQSKQMLLLLDNFEQVVKAAPLLSDLLAACPGVKMLVTSRELLQLYGEHDYPVPPLSLPDLDRLPDLKALSDYEAIELFLQRAQAVSPGFQLTDRNAPAVAEICLRLDGLPLAIELAAARTLVLQPKEILARLKSRLTLLKGGARDLPERQRTLLAAIDWSYNLLDPDEQALFRRLGVFVGGCTLEAIEQVCGGADTELETLDGVTSLVGKSLLSLGEGPHPQDGAPGEPRFLMLETIREYAREKLDEVGELDATADRHLDYFLQVAENEERDLLGDEWLRWMRRLDADQNNLRAALEWSLTREGRAEKGLRLAGALARYWQDRGFLAEGQHWYTQLLNKTEQAEPTAERAKAVRGLARMHFEQGDFTEARQTYWESLEMSRTLGDDRGAAGALRGLAAAALWHGEYDYSLAQLEESLIISRRLGAPFLISTALSLMGTVLMLLGRYEDSEAAFDESLAIDRELRNMAGIAGTLSGQGSVTYHRGDYDRARPLIEEGLAIARESGIEWIMANCLARLGMVALHQAEPEQAEAFLLEGLTRARGSGNRRWSRWYLIGLAEVARLRGKVERAATLIGASEGTIGAAGAQYELAIRLEIDRIIPRVSAELDDETFARLRAAGQAMSPEETIAYALETISEGRPRSEQAGGPLETIPAGAIEPQQPYPDDLTVREMEVLRLIAAGKSNQEIAQGLVLSLRTVERHISNIYQKIGATGRIARATATAYAMRHGLTT